MRSLIREDCWLATQFTCTTLVRADRPLCYTRPCAAGADNQSQGSSLLLPATAGNAVGVTEAAQKVLKVQKKVAQQLLTIPCRRGLRQATGSVV